MTGWKDEYSKAIKDYTEVIRLKPDDALAYANRGIAYNKKGEYDKAIKDYTEAIFLKPNYALAYHWRSKAYIGKGGSSTEDLRRSKADYDKARSLHK